jgi:mannose-6-phosphate isomerase-like protein (cupin superfamily)
MAGAVCISLLLGGYAVAQEKKADKGKAPERVQKVLVDSDTFRVTETTYPPGSSTTFQPGHRVTRALKGGTLVRTHADGKKETVTWKDGEAREQPAVNAPYTLTNPGKSNVVLYTVTLKAKK